MVEGVQQSNIDARIALYDQVGKDHIGGDLLQKTTSFIGRMLSQVFLKDVSIFVLNKTNYNCTFLSGS